MWHEIVNYAKQISWLELIGLISGLLCVLYLIRERVETWFWGIVYVLVSLVVFWQVRLYGDLLLHIVFLVLNIYGWREWTKRKDQRRLEISSIGVMGLAISAVAIAGGIFVFSWFLKSLPLWIDSVPPPDLPVWDSTTSVISVAAIWWTARKYLQNWILWLIVDILATGIYAFKGMYFYSFLYFIYIGFALWGWVSWSRLYQAQEVSRVA